MCAVIMGVCDHDDRVRMVGNYDPFVELDVRVSFRQPRPATRNLSPAIVGTHLTFHHDPEDALAPPGANGHEICPIPGVVIALQTI